MDDGLDDNRQNNCVVEKNLFGCKLDHIMKCSVLKFLLFLQNPAVKQVMVVLTMKNQNKIFLKTILIFKNKSIKKLQNTYDVNYDLKLQLSKIKFDLPQ